MALKVEARGTHVSSDDRLTLVVHVEDDQGTPVVGLKKQHFKVWATAQFFATLTLDVVDDIGSAFPELAGHYHLVRHQWAALHDGTFVFIVVVNAGKKHGGSGRALASVVKVRNVT